MKKTSTGKILRKAIKKPKPVRNPRKPMKSDVKWRPGITFDAFFRGLLFEALLLVQYPNSSYGIIRVAKLLPTNRPHLVSGAGHFFAAGSIARPELDPAVQWDRFSVLSAAYWTSEPGSVMTA